jgi:hypothetical protein
MEIFEKEKGSYIKFSTFMFVMLNIDESMILKQENIICDKDNILINLIKLPNEFLYKKELDKDNKLVVIKPYYVFVVRIKDNMPIDKLDYGGYAENEEEALKEYEKAKKEILKDLE